MMIASGKNSGKRLVNYILRELNNNGFADVVGLSEMGVEKIHRAGQQVANKTAMKVQADPRQEEVKIDKTFKLALVVRFTYSEGGAE